MSRKTDIFEAVLTNPYNHNSFVDFVREFLNDMDIVAPTQYKKVYNNFHTMWTDIFISEIIREITEKRLQYFL